MPGIPNSGGGGISDLFGSPGDIMGGIGQIAGGIGDFMEAGDFSKAASLYGNDVQFEKESTALKEYAANRQIFAGGGAQISVAGTGNFKTSGSVYDIAADTAHSGELLKSQIAVQGAIDEANFEAQQAAASGQAAKSTAGGVAGVLGGIAGIFGI